MAPMEHHEGKTSRIFDPSDFPAFAVLYPDEAKIFRSIAQPLDLPADETVLSDGQQPKFLYMLHFGLLNVLKRHANKTFNVGSITPGEVFGEASILYDAPVGADVRTVGACSLFRLPCEQVREVLESNELFRRSLAQAAERRLAATAIAVNPVFSKLPQPVRGIMLYNAQFVSIDTGETLFKEGSKDIRFMFLILGGKAEVSIKHPTDPSRRIVVARISTGDEVGEISIITGKAHVATVTAVTPIRLILINNEAVHAWRRHYS
ncbi:MAG: cyclic nucleotide-binding domain-containing protein, partial [Mariprofundaceae bacterium]|nr:cyclic nucleotide-binding domain-containing protein [Mariprofundaceae bacterium]